MAAPTAVDIKSTIWLTEAMAVDATLYSDASVKHGHSEIVSVTTGITKVATFSKALAAGVATIDLTAITGPNGVAVDGTGLRVQWAKFVNPGANGNAITIAVGAANGYDGFGAAFSLTIVPGGSALIYAKDGGSDIGATKKDLDLSGTLVQALTVVLAIG